MCLIFLTQNELRDSRIYPWRQIDGLSRGQMHPCSSWTSMHSEISQRSLEDLPHQLDHLRHHWPWNLLKGQPNLLIATVSFHCLQEQEGLDY